MLSRLEGERSMAILLVSLMVLSVISGVPVAAETTEGGTTSVSNAGSAPSIELSNATINDSTESEIQLAYNASGEIRADDIKLSVSGPGYYASANSTRNFSVDTTVDSSEGVVNLTIPQGTFGGGNHTLRASLRNESTRTKAASDTNTVEVTTPIVLSDYSVSETTVNPEENVTVSTVLNNTASESQNYTVAVYSGSFATSHRSVTVAAGEKKQVAINASFSWAGERDITVNDEPETTVTVEEAVSVTDVTVSDQTPEKNETFQVNVTLHNPTSSDRSRSVNVWDGESQYENVDVAAGETKNVSFDVSYSEPGRQTLFAAGERKTVAVLNDTAGTADISVQNTFGPYEVVNNSTGSFYAEAVNTGNASGVQNVTLSVGGTVVDSTLVYVEPNSTAPVFLEHEFSEKGEYTGYINGTDSHEVNVTVRGPVVDDSSVTVEHVGGTEPSELPTVEPVFSGSSISVRTTAGEYNRDLSDIGADESTVFRINFTVQNYTPRVMTSTGQNLSWTTTPAGENRTEVSIKVSPSQLDYKTDFEGGNPSSPAEWDSSVKNDTADFGFDAAILTRVGDAQGDFFEASPSDLGGMTISTNAQLFDTPRYYSGEENEEPRLEIGLAAPHETVDGNVNEGRYRAFLPDSLLDSWNVSDPESELTAGYSASDVDLTVTEVEGGAYVSLSLHYSSGTVTVSKDVSDTTDSEADDSSTSDSTTSDSDDSSTDDSTTSDSDDSSTDDSTTSDSDDSSTSVSDSTDSSVDDESENTVTSTETQTEEATDTATETGTPTETATNEATETTTEVGTTASEETSTGTEVSTPGFGAVVTLVALIAAALLAIRRD